MAIGSDGLKPAMDSRHHLYPFAEAIVFLALVLDAYSRRRTLYAGLATKALKMALNDRTWQAWCSDPPLGSLRPVCLARLHQLAR
jgi:hypothetical protein